MLLILPVLLLSLWSTPGCYGDEHFSHLVLLDELPVVFVTNATPEIVIRTNYSGEIEFRESESFKVLLNITAPSIQDAYAVNSELLEHDGKLLLQVYQKPVAEANVPLRWIFIVIGCASGLVMVLTILYSICWYTSNRDLLYSGRGFRGHASMYRSRSLGPATGDLLGDFDDVFESPDGGDLDDRTRGKLDKLRVSLKPETIIEESEESADDDRTDVKRIQMPGRHWGLKLTENPLANDNLSGSGLLDYPDQSADELDNDVSPEQRIADADGCYTPLDELDDFLQEQDSQSDKMANAKSIGKLPDPRGNLDINIHQSKSDGDLIDDRHMKMSERNKSITPLTVNPPPPKGTQNIEMTVRRAEPNIYQKGLNLKPPENDLNGPPARDSPVRDKTRAQVHTPEKFNNSTGQYVALQLPQESRPRSRGSRESRESNDAFELYTYPADIPLSTFKAPESVAKKESPARYIPKVKPKPLYATASPTGFEYQNLNAFRPVEKQDPGSPGSPGNFSMLSEGSSGDYDEDEHGHILELEDSDLEISPPARDGDMISNASLPLPSPPPIAKIGGYDVTATISQLSQRHSLVDPEDPGKDYGTVIALTGSPSPGGPYSKHSVQPGPDGNRFVFPPPPTVYNPPQHTAWARRELFRDEPAGEYIGLDAPGMPRGEEISQEDRQRERRRSGERNRRMSGERERRMSGGKKGGKPPRLHLAIVSSLCVLSIITGVYCTSSTETSVKIIVYVPPHYPYKNTTVYTALHKDVYLIENAREEFDGINWFESENPVLSRLGSRLCADHHCPHGCDDNTGKCICRHGFKMTPSGCEDVNECQEGLVKCSNEKQGCANTEGSYECLCIGKDLYENFEGECRACSDPCSPGTYEDQPCTESQKKTCRECTKTCAENQYMNKPCSTKSDIDCTTCQPKCNASVNEYEYSQCSATQNRQCKARSPKDVDGMANSEDSDQTASSGTSILRNIWRILHSWSFSYEIYEMSLDRAILPSPVVSSNVVLEDLPAVEDVIKDSHVGFQGTLSFSFRRGNYKRGINVKGSDFWIDAEIKHFNPTALFRPVNHSDAMNKGDYPGSPDVVESYCPYPVPSYYQLFYNVHQNVSYKGNPMDDPASLETCQGELSNFPEMSRTRDQSVICSEPGSFSSVFKMNASYYTQTATEWLEKNDRCRREHEACENCTGMCGLEMIKNSEQCSVTLNDDNNRSPRLPLCFTCCVRRRCSDICKFYHDDRCRMERCQRGNLVQFLLSPIYPRHDEYYCHIEHDPNQLLLRFEYTINFNFQKQRSVLYSRNMSVYADKDWQKKGQTRASDGLLDVEINSELKEMPDFIQRAVGAEKLKVGMYEPSGIPFDSEGISEKLVNIRPLKPFGIDPKSFGSKTCNDDVINLKDIVKATVSGGLYRPMNEELIAFFINGSFLIRNQTSDPNIRFKLRRNTSILKAIYPPARLKSNSLTANMTYNKTHWIVMVTGDLDTRPGYLHLNLSDPAYPNTTIYQFGVGVTCDGNGFFINFSVPTGDSPMISKMFQIRVKDSNSTYQLMIYAPAQETLTFKKVSRLVPAAEEVTSLSPPAEESSSSVTTPTLFVAVVAGAVVFLLFLLLFGVAWRQGIPEGSYLMFRTRHLLMLVVYITFQFAYAVIVTMTVFVLITIAINGETMSFLKQYKLQRSVKTALSQLELDQMEVHLNAELLHLNSVAQQRKTSCEINIKTVMDDVSKLAQEIEDEVTDKVKKQDIKQLITNHTTQVVQQFSRDLLKFRDKYDKAEKFLIHKLSTEMESTYNSVQKSEWLKRGARFIHSFVFNIRTYQHSGATTMPFMQWANLETNMTQLARGLSLPLPDLPVLGVSPQTPNPSSLPKRHQLTNSVPVATETRNQWFIQPSLVPEYNKTYSESHRNQPEEKPRLDSSSYMIFFICMICIDILMLLHRMIKAIGTGKLLLYGYPVYVDARDHKIESTPDEKKLNNNIGRQICRRVIDKILSTYFIPKLIGTLFVGLMVVFILIVSAKFVNRESFKYLGYYNNIEDLMKINENVINTRIRTHAKLINDIEYPMYEQVMNIHIQRHQHILSLVESQWRAVEESQTRAYCTYLKRINVSAECVPEKKDTSLLGVKVDGCLFPPVVPQLYYRDRVTSSKIAESQLDGFLSRIQLLISDTCRIILYYMAVIIIKELLGTVLWIYIKRSGFVSLRIIYETDESPGSADTTANK